MKWLKYGAYAFLGIIALSVLTLYAMGFRASAGKSSTTIEFNRPPAQVWPWLEEKDKFKQWVSWVVDVQDEGPNGIGGKRRTTMKDPNMGDQLIYVDSVITEFTLHKHIKVHLTSPAGFEGDIVYDLEDLGGRTRLTMSGAFKYDSWLATLMEPIITPQAKAKEDADFAKLKSLVEQ